MAKRIITTENLEEDSKIEGQLRPQLLSEYIGQAVSYTHLDVYKRQELQIFQREKMRHLLLHGMDWNVWNVVPAVMSVRRNVS